CVLCCFFFFFFQAEDGIRDFHVTGVQTCALPISHLNLIIGNGNASSLIVPFMASGTLTRDSADLREATGATDCRLEEGVVLKNEIGRASCRERGWETVVGEARRKEGK